MNIKYIEPFSIAYITHQGLDGIECKYNEVLQWTSQFKELGSIVRLYHENFNKKPRENVKMDLGIQVYEPIDIEGKVLFKDVIPNYCIVNSLEICSTEFTSSWSNFYKWLQTQPYTQSSTPPFEIIHNNYLEHPDGKCIVDLHIPIIQPNT